MGGFLGGLTDLLGGFNAARRIDTEGFDWREKQAQENAAREQQQRGWEQQNEDWATKAAAEAALGTPEGEDISSLIPGQVNQARVKARVGGAIPQMRSQIEAQKAETALRRQGMQGEQRLAEIGARGDEAQELAEIQAKLRGPLTEYQRQTLQLRAQALQAMAARGGQAAGRADKVPGVGPQGQAGTWFIPRGGGEREFFPAAQTAGTRGKEEARGAAMTAFSRLMQNFDAVGEAPDDGLQARARGLKLGAEAAAGYNPNLRTYKSGVRGFVPLMARALGHVGVLTELDVERTEALFPSEYDTRAEKEQKRAMLSEIMSGQGSTPWQLGSLGGKPVAYIDENGEIHDLRGGAAPPSSGGRPAAGAPSPRTPEAVMPPSTAGPGDVRTFGGRKYRLKSGLDPRLKSSWEEL